jgi:GNAT superfamily N-acetyltransferase
MTTTIRHAAPGDEPDLARLFGEMQDHYEQPTPHETALALAATVCAGGPAAPIGLVAERGDGLVAFALLNRVRPGDHLLSLLFLKDIYVSDAARSGGVGRRLLAACARLTREGGYTRLDWTTEADNPARTLYDRVGAKRQNKLFYRLAGDDLARLAEEA